MTINLLLEQSTTPLTVETNATTQREYVYEILDDEQAPLFDEEAIHPPTIEYAVKPVDYPYFLTIRSPPNVPSVYRTKNPLADNVRLS